MSKEEYKEGDYIRYEGRTTRILGIEKKVRSPGRGYWLMLQQNGMDRLTFGWSEDVEEKLDGDYYWWMTSDGIIHVKPRECLTEEENEEYEETKERIGDTVRWGYNEEKKKWEIILD